MKAYSDVNRLRILNLLQDNTLCVCDLEEVLGLNQSNLSRHLAKLRSSGLVLAQKRGLFAYYRRLPLPEPYRSMGNQLYDSMRTDPQFEADLKKLAEIHEKNAAVC